MFNMYEPSISEEFEPFTHLEDEAFQQLVKPRRKPRSDKTPWHTRWKGKRIFRKKSTHHSHVPITH